MQLTGRRYVPNMGGYWGCLILLVCLKFALVLKSRNYQFFVNWVGLLKNRQKLDSWVPGRVNSQA